MTASILEPQISRNLFERYFETKSTLGRCLGFAYHTSSTFKITRRSILPFKIFLTYKKVGQHWSNKTISFLKRIILFVFIIIIRCRRSSERHTGTGRKIASHHFRRRRPEECGQGSFDGKLFHSGEHLTF